MSLQNYLNITNGLYKLVPQREYMLMLDIIKHIDEEKITAIKETKPGEFGFSGHFPGNPIFPGALMLEAMGQAAVALVSYNLGIDHRETTNNIYLTAVEEVKLSKIVKPGDSIDITAYLYKTRNNMWIFDCRVTSRDNNSTQIARADKLKVMVN